MGRKRCVENFGESFFVRCLQDIRPCVEMMMIMMTGLGVLVGFSRIFDTVGLGVGWLVVGCIDLEVQIFTLKFTSLKYKF